MAKIIPSLGELTGSIGGNTFQRNASGQIVRARPRVGKKSTTKQSNAHNRLSYWNYMWQYIGETSRAGWNTYAATWTKGNRYGVTKYLTGANWFMSVNETLHLATSTFYADPQPHNLPAAVPLFSVLIEGATINLIIDTSFDYTDNALLVYTSLPTSRSSNSINRLRKFMCSIQASPGAVYNVTSLWETATGLSFNSGTSFPDLNIFFAIQTVHTSSGIASTETVDKANIGQPYAWDADMLTYISYFSTPPTLTRKYLLDILFVGLKSAGIFAELDRLYLFASETQQAGNLSLINPGGSAASPINSPSWSTSGYTSNGTSSYIHSNFNPLVSGIKYTQNSACMFIYSRTNAQVAGDDFAVQNGLKTVYLESKWTDNNTYVTINDSGAGYITLAGLDTHSLMCIARSSSVLQTFYRNGVSQGTDTTVSTALANLPVFIAAGNYGGTPLRWSTRQYAFWGAGSSAINQATFYTLMHDYLVAIGAS